MCEYTCHSGMKHKRAFFSYALVLSRACHILEFRSTTMHKREGCPLCSHIFGLIYSLMKCTNVSKAQLECNLMQIFRLKQ